MHEFVKFSQNFPLTTSPATMVAILNFLNFQEFGTWAGDKCFTKLSRGKPVCHKSCSAQLFLYLKCHSLQLTMENELYWLL